MRRQTVRVLVGTLIVAGCSGNRTKEGTGAPTASRTWSYQGPTGPDRWGDLGAEFATCASGQAHPDRPFRSVTRGPGPSRCALPTRTGPRREQRTYHRGRVREWWRFAELGSRSYPLTQFHFHAPSEHRLNGLTFPLEIHFVHRHAEQVLAVLAVFVEEGGENPALTPLIEGLDRLVDGLAALGRTDAATFLSVRRSLSSTRVRSRRRPVQKE